MLKKSLLLFVTLFVFLLGNVEMLTGQTLQIVAEPAPQYDYATNFNHPGGFWGYAANPVIFNNQLYVQYQQVTQDGTFDGIVPLQLAVLNNNSLNLIANPDTAAIGKASAYVFQSTPMVYNNKLCINYLDKNSVNRLAVYNGSALSLVANPDASKYGYQGNPIVFNSKLYIQYANPSGTNQLASYDGTSIKLIANPDASPYGYQGNPVVFNGKLYLKYAVNNSNGTWHLAQFDGITLTVLANPDASPYGYQGNPIIYNNKLYLQYTNVSGVNQLMVYDGTNAPTLIANPDNGGGYTGLPIVYSGNLYIQYRNASGVLQLGKYNGTVISLIPNPDATTYGYWNTPVVYNNTLCIFYRNAAGVHQLAVYNGGNSLKLITNPDASPNGYWDQPIVYGANLYYQYYNASSVLQLGYFDGTAMRLIANPKSVSINSVNYEGLPIVFNNLLYLQYNEVEYAQFANLVSLNQSALPVTFVNFNGTLQNNEGQLTWSTASELNNEGFEVQKSMDGSAFSDIGFVAGHGNSSLMNTYNFTDEKVLSGSNYYRLKQIDLDGKFSYSSVIKLDYSKLDWEVMGNPVSKNSRLQLQLDKASNVSIQIFSLDGKNIQTINKGNISEGTYSIPLNLGNVSKGMYLVQLVVNGNAYTKTVVK